MAVDKLNLAVLISGRGSNLGSLINSCQNNNFPAQINIVISDNPDAKGLELAKSAHIETVIINRKNYETNTDFEQAINNIIDQHSIDLICLAGFMRLLSKEFVENRHDKIINIHPSLLPAYKGLNTHERAINDKQSESGCTVHFVRPEMDSGPIIVQKTVSITDNETPDSLAKKILEQEHKAYPEAIRIIAQSTNNLLL